MASPIASPAFQSTKKLCTADRCRAPASPKLQRRQGTLRSPVLRGEGGGSLLLGAENKILTVSGSGDVDLNIEDMIYFSSSLITILSDDLCFVLPMINL